MSLNNELDRFGQLFKQNLNDSIKAAMKWVSPTSVDWEAKTMTAVDGDGLAFYDVLLGVGTIAVKPAIGTDCLIAVIEADDATAFMLYADEAEAIVIDAGSLQYNSQSVIFNNGDNGGLIMISPLISWMQKVSADMKTLKSLLLSKTVAGNGAPLGISFNPQTPDPEQSDFENEKVKH